MLTLFEQEKTSSSEIDQAKHVTEMIVDLIAPFPTIGCPDFSSGFWS